MTTQEVRQKRLEILTWERDHRNLNNRAIDIMGDCVYSHKSNGGCAVGRLLSEELAEKISDLGQIEIVVDYLPPEIKELGIGFLEELQLLHDGISNWNDNGLSSKGMKDWEDLRRKWCV
jgi:hypothetical protein